MLGGLLPPVSQFITSTVCIIGIFVPEDIWVIQPILPVAIKSGDIFLILFTLFLSNSPAIFCCKIL